MLFVFSWSEFNFIFFLLQWLVLNFIPKYSLVYCLLVWQEPPWYFLMKSYNSYWMEKSQHLHIHINFHQGWQLRFFHAKQIRSGNKLRGHLLNPYKFIGVHINMWQKECQSILFVSVFSRERNTRKRTTN